MTSRSKDWRRREGCILRFSTTKTFETAPSIRAGWRTGCLRTCRRSVGPRERALGRMGMETRYSFGGDDHIFVEVDEEMSLDAFFKSLSMTNAVRESRIKGVTEICPANASYQIRFDPDLISPNDMLTELKRLESAAKSDHTLSTRILEVP